MVRIALMAWLCMGCLASAAELVARPGEASLKSADETYPQVSIEANWYPSYAVDDKRYRVEVDQVVGLSQHRTATGPEAYKLHWLGETGGIACLAADLDWSKADPNETRPWRTFHRLDLKTMEWLDPFVLPEPSIDRPQNSNPFSSPPFKRDVHAEQLIVTPRGIILLCRESVEGQTNFAGAAPFRMPVGHHVTMYEPTATDPLWTHEIKSDMSEEHRVGIRMNSYEGSIQPLQFVATNGGGMVIVCTGELGSLVGIHAEKGKPLWRIPAIWEYERARTGPSSDIFSMERFALDWVAAEELGTTILDDGEEKVDAQEIERRVRRKLRGERALEAAKRKFYARMEGRITAGPYLVPGKDWRGNARMYIAVARSTKPEPDGYQQPEHSILYEIDPKHGSISALARLPKVILGEPSHALPGSLVVTCEDGGMARILPYDDHDSGSVGPDDYWEVCMLPVDWYREYRFQEPYVFGADRPEPGIFAIAGQRIFRPIAETIDDKKAHEYRLLLNVIDGKSGLNQTLTLTLPIDGRRPTPEELEAKRKTEKLFGIFGGPVARYVWLKHLQVNQNQLTAVIAHGKEQTAVTFDISKLLAAPP